MEENGAVFAGETDLIQKIFDDAFNADFCVAVSEIMPKSNPLKNKLEKYLKLLKNAICCDIPKMCQLFKTRHEITVDV